MAAKVAAQQVQKDAASERLTASEIEELPGMVSEHLRHLCRTYKNSVRPNAEELQQAELKRASASSRRSTLYESRLKIIDHFPSSLGKHRRLILGLGLDGTSSDEEDPDRPNAYWIKRRPELSSKVQVIKSKLDLAYSLWCKGPGTKGSQMHARYPSDKVSTREVEFVDLPITCFSRTWLLSLTEEEKEFYQFGAHQYDYSFPDGLLRRNNGRKPEDIVMSDDDEEL
ncbi:hypothetical protein FRC10_003477 [Ceratobasidium sp. 414]|nr:hypothetical protein FRC10_003477 [Ceratobasidium sp. 414]